MRYVAMVGVLICGLGVKAAPTTATEVTLTVDPARTRVAIDASSPAALNFAVRKGVPRITAIHVALPLSRGPETSASLVVTLWDRMDGHRTTGAVVLSRVVKRAVDLGEDDEGLFVITLRPRGLAPGSYSLSLTSSAAEGQGYVFGGARLRAEPSALIDPNPVKAVPEPLSILSTVVGVGLVGLYGLRQRRRYAQIQAS